MCDNLIIQLIQFILVLYHLIFFINFLLLYKKIIKPHFQLLNINLNLNFLTYHLYFKIQSIFHVESIYKFHLF